MGDVRLTAPRVRVKRDGHDDLEIQADNRDLLAFERTRLKQRPVWPKMEDSPFQWLTFLAWSAARRSGAIGTDVTYERWEDEVLDVAAITADDVSELGSPTEPGPGPG
jgi:hypothetical protein